MDSVLTAAPCPLPNETLLPMKSSFTPSPSFHFPLLRLPLVPCFQPAVLPIQISSSSCFSPLAVERHVERAAEDTSVDSVPKCKHALGRYCRRTLEGAAVLVYSGSLVELRQDR